MIVLRYKDVDIRVMIVGSCGLVEILVLRFVIPVACTYGEPLCNKVEHDLFIYGLPYEWRSGTSDGLFLPIYPPRSMRVVLHFDN